jgi:hypothetical protein
LSVQECTAIWSNLLIPIFGDYGVMPVEIGWGHRPCQPAGKATNSAMLNETIEARVQEFPPPSFKAFAALSCGLEAEDGL